jgi:OFA family oxalate/formate antiporter-like MFS transporter
MTLARLRHVHYGWVIVAICMGILATHALTFYAYGIFLKPLTAEFQWDRGAYSGAYSVCVVVSGGLGILSGRLTDKYGPRLIVTASGLLCGAAFFLMPLVNALWQLYLVWGILMGTGSAFCFIPVMAIIPRWFVKRRGTVMGIVMGGMALGGIVTPPLAQWLISAYKWREAFIILGIITVAVMVPIAQFMRPSPHHAGLKPYGEDETAKNEQAEVPVGEGLSFRKAIRTSRFWLFGLIEASMFFCFGTVLVHLVPLATDLKVPEIVAASILSISAGISVMARLVIGLLADRIGSRLTLAACVSMVTLAMTWLLFAQETWMFYLFAVLFGLSYGGFMTLLPVVAAELFGLSSLGAIIGGISFVSEIGEGAGPPLSGSIYDITRSYQTAFLVCAIICAAAIALTLALLRYKAKERKPLELAR